MFKAYEHTSKGFERIFKSSERTFKAYELRIRRLQKKKVRCSGLFCIYQQVI